MMIGNANEKRNRHHEIFWGETMRITLAMLTRASLAFLLFSGAVTQAGAETLDDLTTKGAAIANQAAILIELHQRTSAGSERVPNVVGLMYTDAESALRKANFQAKLIFQDPPNPKVRYGHVLATVPSAGTVAQSREVEVHIPRSASRLGIGGLGVNDVERKTGFDLDEGRYEEISRGADIVLRKHENQPQIDGRGNSRNKGAGLYIEPSDGSILASLTNVRDIIHYGIGSAAYYAACQSALQKTPSPGVEISRTTDSLETLCVLTSRGSIVAVEFKAIDMTDKAASNYEFRDAVFPLQSASGAPHLNLSSR